MLTVWISSFRRNLVHHWCCISSAFVHLMPVLLFNYKLVYFQHICFCLMRVVWLVSFPKYQTIKFVFRIFQKWDIYCKSKRMYNAHKFAHTVTVVSVNFVSIGCWHWTCNILNNLQYIAKGSIKLLGYCFIGCFIIQNHVYIALCKLFILFHSSFWWLNSESHYLNVPVAKWGRK